MAFPNIAKLFAELNTKNANHPLHSLLQLLDILSTGEISRIEENIDQLLPLSQEELGSRAADGEPMAYILGLVPFMGLQFPCRPGALIPRRETELLVHAVLNRLPADQPHTVIDMCTGSGNIAVALAAAHPRLTVHAADISSEAITLAGDNVRHFDLERRITLYCGDMFVPLAESSLHGSCDAVICNPPYFPVRSLDKLPRDIRDHEPELALNAGPYGIDFFRRLIHEAPTFLRRGGLLAFEIGAGQEKIVRRLLEKSGTFSQIDPYFDQNGIVRGFLAVST